MKELKDFSKQINTCSKCGLCQSVCPIYKLTGNECAVSKGKFVMLEGVIKGDLKLNKTINKYLEMCLKCGKCTDFCPSGIDICEIFKAAKHEYLQNSLEGKIVKLIQSKYIFDNTLTLLDKITPKTKNNIEHKPDKKNILFFRGCANKISPNSENAIRKTFKDLSYNIIDEDFKCCGLPFSTSGNIERFNEVLEHNIKIINSTDCDFVLTDCASCEDVLKKYPNINKKIINYGEFCASENIKFEFDKKYKVTFHKPCHLKNDDFLKKILSNCKNIEYIEMENYDDCCGFAGQFAITNHKLSKELSVIKAEKVINTGAEIILTACPGCILGLKQGLHYYKKNKNNSKHIKIMNISEFLGLANKIYL